LPLGFHQIGNLGGGVAHLFALCRPGVPHVAGGVVIQVYCVLGNLYNGKPGGHAWVQVNLGQDYIIESTRADVASLVPVAAAERYEVVHLFNDKTVQVIKGVTVMEPFSACFSTWLKDYLDWGYIEDHRSEVL
ncbi:hypothetical protein LCGC14_1781230, partial [marine sediment metagenome]